MRRTFVLFSWLLLSGCAHRAGWIHAIHLHGLPPHKDEPQLASEASPLLHNKYLEGATLEADRARLETYLHTHGYFDAEVQPAKVTPFKDGVDIDFTVGAGAITRIRSVRGTERLKVGNAFDHAEYLAVKAALEKQLQSAGHAWATVAGEVRIDRAARAADVVLEAHPGPLVRFGKLEVQGTTQRDAVERRVSILEGAPFRPEALTEAEARLRDVGLFSTIRLECRRDAARPEIADVVVTVEEAAANELKVSAGFGIEPQRTDVHAALGWMRHNFLGGLRTLKLRIAPAYVATPAFWNISRQGPAGTVEAQLLQPDRPWRQSALFATLGYDLGLDYAYQFHGPRLELGFTQALWHDRVRLMLSYDFQALFFFATDRAILEDPERAGRLYGYLDPYRLGFWQEQVALDLRDRPVDTRRGAYAALSAEEGGEWAGGAFDYEKLQPEVRGYLPLGGRVVLAARAEYGHLFTQGDVGSPITRRFRLGGPTTHRGFTYDRLSPQVGTSALPVGGDQMVLLQAELRSDLLEAASYGVSMAVFVDAGDVTAADKLDMTRLHCATGGGLRLKTVLGTLRADVGVRLNRLAAMESDGAANPDPGQRVAFHVSFGEAF
jgi:translocation and assembly module TamA